MCRRCLVAAAAKHGMLASSTAASRRQPGATQPLTQGSEEVEAGEGQDAVLHVLDRHARLVPELGQRAQASEELTRQAQRPAHLRMERAWRCRRGAASHDVLATLPGRAVHLTMAIRPTNSSLAAVKPISTGMPLAFLDWMPGSVMLKRWAGASLTSEALPDLVAFLVAGDTRRLLVPPFAGLVEVDPARRSRRPPRTAVTLRGGRGAGARRVWAGGSRAALYEASKCATHDASPGKKRHPAIYLATVRRVGPSNGKRHAAPGRMDPGFPEPRVQAPREPRVGNRTAPQASLHGQIRPRKRAWGASLPALLGQGEAVDPRWLASAARQPAASSQQLAAPASSVASKRGAWGRPQSPAALAKPCGRLA